MGASLMISIVPKSPFEAVVFSSSLKDDFWHEQCDPKSYELWYFDALSDDGKELITITFLDNFVFSSNYNQLESAPDSDIEASECPRFPAVSFSYFSNGELICRSVTEHTKGEFEGSRTMPDCRIGTSFFKHQTAEYGSGFTVSIDAPLAKQRRVEAHFEWLSVESDLLPGSGPLDKQHHFWNVVVPRADVTGRITIVEKDGTSTDVRHFRGTGYHDHRLDNRWLADTVADLYWGRAHFADSTAVFCHYRESGDGSSTNKLLVIRNGELRIRDCDYRQKVPTRDIHGLKYPGLITLRSDDGLTLNVRPTEVVNATFYFVRCIAEMSLTLRDGIVRNNTGLVEFLVPGALKNRWINWLNDA